jgi:NADPH:quinone reductase-like Zn-dependent oxidoreductase
MKAIVYHRYGPPDVLQCEEIDKPVVGDDDVLIKVRAAAANPMDRVFNGKVRLMTGLRKPKEKRVGADVAGEVEAVGRNVTEFKPGDEVFGVSRGAFAEYASTPHSALALKPPNMTFEQAAAAGVAGLTALQGLRDKGRIQPGHKVLVNGASGGVGTFAVQIARSFGADVTAVCSTRNVEMVRSIGAGRVIDYTQEDFTKDAQRYDLIFDAVGNRPLSALRRILEPTGICLLVGAPATISAILLRALNALILSRLVSQKFILYIAKRKKEDLNVLRDLMQSGKLTPVIDRRYRLDEVPDAMRPLEEGHARGKIVVVM